MRYRGLANVSIQVLIVCMMVNCKRMACVHKRVAKLQAMGTGAPGGADCARPQAAVGETSKKAENEHGLRPLGAKTALRA